MEETPLELLADEVVNSLSGMPPGTISITKHILQSHNSTSWNFPIEVNGEIIDINEAAKRKDEDARRKVYEAAYDEIAYLIRAEVPNLSHSERKTIAYNLIQIYGQAMMERYEGKVGLEAFADTHHFFNSLINGSTKEKQEIIDDIVSISKYDSRQTAFRELHTDAVRRVF